MVLLCFYSNSQCLLWHTQTDTYLRFKKFLKAFWLVLVIINNIQGVLHHINLQRSNQALRSD